MREDKYTNTPEDAASYEQLRGCDAAIDQSDFVHVRTPFCRVCQRGTKAYVCGPCERERWRAHVDEH
jgi:hypothetical protein